MDRAAIVARMRDRIRRLLRPSAALAYALIFIHILDAIQRIELAGRMAGLDSVLDIIRDWGWIFGLAWLAYLVLAPSREETLHAVNAERLRRQLVDLLLRIERLSCLYEMSDFKTGSHRAALQDRRRDLVQYSVADLIECVLDGVPKEHRSVYELNAVAGATVDLVKTPQEQLSTLAKEEDHRVTSGLSLYLERRRKSDQGNYGM